MNKKTNQYRVEIFIYTPNRSSRVHSPKGSFVQCNLLLNYLFWRERGREG